MLPILSVGDVLIGGKGLNYAPVPCSAGSNTVTVNLNNTGQTASAS
jgi:hypothetical protein